LKYYAVTAWDQKINCIQKIDLTFTFSPFKVSFLFPIKNLLCKKQCSRFLIYLCADMCVCAYTGGSFCHIFEHCSCCCRNIVTEESHICQEFTACISATIQLRLLYWGFSICQTSAYQQALHLLKILLNTQYSLLCNISNFC